MRKLLLAAALILGLATSGWATVLNLNIGNPGVLSGDLTGFTGSFGTVTITGSNVVFAGAQGVLFNGHTFNFEMSEIGLNLLTAPQTATGISVVPGPNTTSGVNFVSESAGNMDGFGNFNFRLNSNGSQGAPGAVEQVLFSLPDPTLALNNQGFLAAAHIIAFEDGYSRSGVNSTGFAANGGTPVPEPGTMMLLGAGFLGLAIYGKRRRNA